jgi:O-antigen/teichoic acid export membrane protein
VKSLTAGALGVRRLGGEAIAVMAGQAVGALGLLAAVRLLSSLMAPADYGTFALGLTLVLLASQLLFGPIANAVLRFYSAADERFELGQFWAALRGLVGLASIIGLVLGGIALAILEFGGYPITPVLAVSATAFAVLSGWETLLDYLQSAQRRRWTVAWHQAIRQLLRPAIAGALIITMGHDIVGWAFAGYAIASALVLGSQLTFVRASLRHLGQRNPYDYWERLFHFALPFTAWGLFTWAQLSSDRWALQLTDGVAVVGRYTVLMQLGAQPLLLLGTALAQLFEPMVYARASLGENPSLGRSAFLLNARVTLVSSAAMLAIVVVEWFAHPLIFAIVVAPEYWDVSALLPVAALSGGLFASGQLFAIGSVVLGTSRALVAPKTASAILGIALNVIGAYLFGLTGVLVAGVLTALVFGSWVTAQSLRRYFETGP